MYRQCNASLEMSVMDFWHDISVKLGVQMTNRGADSGNYFPNILSYLPILFFSFHMNGRVYDCYVNVYGIHTLPQNY